MSARLRELLLLCLVSALPLACLAEFSLFQAETEGETEVPECQEEDELCDGECVSLEDDARNCGECGRICLGATECFEGECVRFCDDGCDRFTELCEQVEYDDVCLCREGLDDCDGLCVDLRTDSDHCGACFNVCPEGHVCGDSECTEATCEEFEDACPDSCTNLDIDPMNCGVCGRRCASDELCFAGDCALYEEVDPELCNECPCLEECPLGSCCYSDFLDHEVCAESGVQC